MQTANPEQVPAAAVPVLPARTGLFELGELAATPNAMAAIITAGKKPNDFLVRHVAGDWSEMAEEDRATNSNAVLRGGRIFSSYAVSRDVRIWVITEADRSVTSILLPSEY